MGDFFVAVGDRGAKFTGDNHLSQGVFERMSLHSRSSSASRLIDALPLDAAGQAYDPFATYFESEDFDVLSLGYDAGDIAASLIYASAAEDMRLSVDWLKSDTYRHEFSYLQANFDGADWTSLRYDALARVSDTLTLTSMVSYWSADGTSPELWLGAGGTMEVSANSAVFGSVDYQTSEDWSSDWSTLQVGYTMMVSDNIQFTAQADATFENITKGTSSSFDVNNSNINVWATITF